MEFRYSEDAAFNYLGYFSRAVVFLNKYRWIFCNTNTKFIRDGVLESLPPDWIEDLRAASNDEFNDIPLGFIKDSWSPSFREFLCELKRLSVVYDQHDGDVPKAQRGVSIKKCYEIENLASFFEIVKPVQETNLVVDFGCGLGYLSQLIHERYGLSVLGIEGNPLFVQLAQERQKDLYPSSEFYVQYVNHYITRSSSADLRREVVERFARAERVSIVGLHACADLSVDAMLIFLRSSWIKNLIIMPCCYHKMNPKSKSNYADNLFENIPLSKTLTAVLSCVEEGILCRPFLRLGCQQTAARWKHLTTDDHLKHGRVMFRRGLIDAALNDGESVKIAKLKEVPNTTTVANLLQQFSLQSGTQWTEQHRAKIGALLTKYPDGERLAEYLECLQTCLQSVCENVILLDRMCFMENLSELRGEKIRRNLVRLKNDGLSPRCFILYASKIE